MMFPAVLEEMISEAIAVLQENEPEDGFLAGFSGGKDSIVMLDILKRSGCKYEAYFSMTTVDPPELIRFIKRNYPEVTFIKPQKSMFELIKEKRFLPTRKIRFCCYYLKERVGAGRVIVTGIRAEESAKRAERSQVEEGRQKGKKFVHPLFPWREVDVWEYIDAHNLKYPSLYDKGARRIGCILCPYQSAKQKKKDAEKYPLIKRNFIRSIQYLQDEKYLHCNTFGDFSSAEEVFEWWISDLSVAEYVKKKQLIKNYLEEK